MKLVVRADFQPKVLFLLTVVAPALFPLKLETKERVVSYNLQRIMRQFGFDQGSVMFASETALSSIHNSESKFIGEGRDQILSSVEMFFYRSRGRG